MNVKLHTKFMKNTVAKMISKIIQTKTGHNVGIHIEDLDFNVIDGEAIVSTNVTVKIDNKELKEIIKSLT